MPTSFKLRRFRPAGADGRSLTTGTEPISSPADSPPKRKPPVEVGLTGGIGAGKSTVSAALAARGARIVDADAIVRELQAPGSRVFDAMVRRWGDAVLAEDGKLDRAAVAALVFEDADEPAALNAIVHPAVAVELAARPTAALAAAHGDPAGAVVVLDIPLLVRADGEPIKRDYQNLSGIVVVDADTETAVRRLVEGRGFTAADARARIANQASRRVRIAVADFVIDNNGSFAYLEPQIDACWQWALSLR